MHRIVIIGAGFSGTLVAVQLLRQSRRPLHITLVERRQAQIAAGVAYGTASPCHLLNVPAGAISALPDQPDHFLRWARSRTLDPAIDAGAFLPRRLYGDYLRELFNDSLRGAATGCQLELVIDEAVAVRPQPGGARVQLRGGRVLTATQVVLALGNFPPGQAFAAGSARYHAEPWSAGVLAALLAARSCLIIGTGLTMVDLAIELQEQGYTGAIHVVSRRGLLPATHAAPNVSGPPPGWIETPSTARALLRQLRRQIAACGDWRACIDALRPHSQTLWRALPLAEQRRFLRHLRPYWDSHRHRLAPRLAQQLDTLLAEGQLRRHVGRIEAIETAAAGVAVRIRRRGGGSEILHVEQVVNCTGSESDYRKLKSPLVTHLLGQGLVRSDALGLGLAVDADCALLNAHGVASPWLYTLGPVQKGTLWETTAVPELRQQAQALAAVLLAAAARRLAAHRSAG